MRILLWRVHGGWTDAFLHGDHEFLLPTTGRQTPVRRGNVLELPPDQLDREHIDVAVLQRTGEFELLADALGPAAEQIPVVYLEHNTPGGRAAMTRHPLADRPDLLLVHVTHFNRAMWDCGSTPTVVIPHGLPDPGHRYTGEIPGQAVVINEATRRGRAVGADLLPELAAVAPIDLFGIDCERFAGHGVTPAGNLPPDALHTEMARRRVYLHTTRWTSLGLSLIEAMQLGMPVVALATTEAPAAVPPLAGFVSCDLDELSHAIRMLIKDPELADRMGRAARHHALSHFGLDPFLRRWDEVLERAVAGHRVLSVSGRRAAG